MIYSDKLSFDIMTLDDVYEFKNWSKHKSNLYQDYNFEETTDQEILEWYNWKNRKNSKYYTIFLDNKPIGYISFKKLNKIKKSAILGLVIDPGKIEKGYGKEALRIMLDFYFNKFKFVKIFLLVARYNKRAINLYEKFGFKKYSSSIMVYPNGKLDKNSLDYIENKDSFINIMGKLFFYADKMVLDKNTFNEVVKCISNSKN
ncbi:MAG: GNAT family N-acetyltransferase [Peptoniphilaceae bacterium]